jgi:RNA polymerase sigma-70 factor (ECF subfamily)
VLKRFVQVDTPKEERMSILVPCCLQIGGSPDLYPERNGVKADSEFEGFYESEAQAVFSAVFLLCRSRVEAEDATQEAFVRAFERWDRLRSQSWAASWVTTTALNVARRGLRRRPRGLQTRESDNSAANSIDLWAMVRRLPRRQQETVVLHYRMDLSVREIAVILGCQEGTIRTHLARAREVLRRSLEEGSDGY